MKTGMKLWWTILCAVVCASAGQTSWAQKAPVASRVMEQIDETRTVHILGNVHPLARAEFDRGAVAGSQPMTRMLLLLQRSAEQETALRQLLDAQQTKRSGSYHAWLTPAQFGQQFGPSDADVQAVTEWLTEQGFQVAKLSAGRTTVEFSGTAAQVQTAFRTQIHHFVVNGNEHIANVSDPSIPEALSPVVAGVVALNNFPKHSMMHRVGSFQRDLATGQVKPLFTYTDMNGTFYGVGPADFATIYNIPAGADGSGQSIAVVGQSNINIQDVRDFRTMFGLAANDPQIIVNGPDPGILASTGDEGESDLDVEWAGAVAPAAQVLFVVSQSTMSNPAQVSQGVDLSALYIVDNNLAPVMGNSYGNCEAALGSTGNSFYNALWQQATAEGITVVIAAGDNGSAGCDPDPTIDPNAASQGLAVNGFASTPYGVAVGGTDFNQSTNASNYWNSTNAATTQLSAKGYISEVPWDDSACAANFPTACTAVDSGGADISAGSGGASNCATFDGNGNCSAGYPKPAYQTGVTPADSVRDIPDISLFASNGFNNSFYIVCQSDANPNDAPCDLSTSATSGTHNFQGVGGTSGGTPAFAAIIALVNQKTGQRQGNANYILYALGKNEDYTKCNSSSFTNPGTPAPATCVFYDITTGNNAVACVAGSPNCSNTGSTGFGVMVSGSSTEHGNPAFQAVAGYDLATGLGSINVANLLNLWSSITRQSSATALTGATGGSPSGTTFTAKATVTPTPTGAVGTESVALNALASDGTTILASMGPFTLTNGVANISTNLLPPNTVSVVATYGGDVLLGASTSPAVAVAVVGANQTSKTTMSFVTFDANNNPILSTAAQSITYGSPYILQAAVIPSSGPYSGKQCWSSSPVTAFPCPTGTVAVTDNGNPLNDWPNAGTPNATNAPKLNNQGIAEDQPIQLPVGSHSIVATYAGDPNYQTSTSNTLSVTVAKASTTTAVASSVGTITSGATVTLTALVSTPSNGAGPTGNVTFTNGSATLGTGACAATSGTNNPNGTNGTTAGTAFCTATLTTAISSLYPLPQSRPRPPVVPIVWLAMSIVAYLALLRWRPASRKRVYAYAGLVVFALMAVAIAGCGGGGGGGGGGGKTVTINASYPGDANYNSSTGSTNVVVQ
jgi:hypothetical protein